MLVDESRFADASSANGQYLLTGSANVQALPRISDALVGRMSLLTLYPLSAIEVTSAKGTFLSQLLNNDFRTGVVGNTNSCLDVMRRATFPEITDLDENTRQQGSRLHH